MHLNALYKHMNTWQVTLGSDISGRSEKPTLLQTVQSAFNACVLPAAMKEKRQSVSDWACRGRRGGVRQSHPHSSELAWTAENRAGLLPPPAAAVCSCLTWSHMWQPTPTAEYTLLELGEHRRSSHCRADSQTQSVTEENRNTTLYKHIMRKQETYRGIHL